MGPVDTEKFTQSNAPNEGGTDFQKDNHTLLDIPLDGRVPLKPGLMVVYSGDVTLTGKSTAEGGLTGFIRSAVSSEETPIRQTKGKYISTSPSGERKFK